MRVDLLGPLRIRATEKEIAVSGARLRSLAVLLALNVGAPVSAERVAGALWTGRPPSANTVQSLVSRLRTALGDRSLIETGPGGYRLRLPESHVDLLAFEALAARGHAALTTADFATAATDLRAALSLWRGEPDDLTAVDPAAAVRAATRRESVRDDLAEAELGLGNAALVLPELRARAAAQPGRERVQAQLLRALTATGAHTEALTLYQTVATRLAEELGVDPGPALVEAHRQALRADAAAPAHEHNLPEPLTSFIGRETEVAALTEALADHRLVTVTGPGGSGKTRLAIHTAHRLAADTDVRMAELAPVTDAAAVGHTVVAALGLNDTRGGIGPLGPGRGDPAERIAAAIADRPLLLVLDNCEHLLDAVAPLADRLLRRCPRLRLLVTGRQPLRLTGEVIHPVPELPYPTEAVDPITARAYPAVRLLLDRAAAATPDFTLTVSNLTAVTEICRRLDGLPLAIELAAARLRALTPRQLADRLGERFRLLSDGDRTALPRQRTLRAVVDWSWDMLAVAERELLARLSVFVGDMPLAAIEAVCEPDRADTAYTLAALVDKSLVTRTGDRYRLLETIREYGAERLAELGETDRLRHHHGEYFAQLATAADSRLRGPDQEAWLARLSAQSDDLAAAVRRGVADGAVDRAARIVSGLGWFWWLRGRWIEAGELANLVLDAPETAEPDPARSALVLLVSTFAAHDGPDGLTTVRRRLIAARRLRDRHGVADAHPFLRLLDVMLAFVGDDNRRLLRLAHRLDRDPDPWVSGGGLTIRALILSVTGRVGRAEELHLRALERYRRAGDRWGLAMSAAALAELAHTRGDLDTARGHLDVAEAAERGLGVSPGESQVRTRPVYLLVGVGDPRRKLGELEAAIVTARRGGEPELAGYLHLLSALYRRHLGDSAAKRHLEQARAILEPRLTARHQGWSGPPDLWALLQVLKARFAVDAGIGPEADGPVAAALTAAADSGEGTQLAVALETAADLELRRGAADTAALRLGQAALARGIGDAASADVARTVTGARAALGDADFADRFERGRTGQTRSRLFARLRSR